MFLRFFKPDPILALILSIPIALPFSNLNRLNVLSTCYKVVPIDIAQSLEFRLCWIKLCRRDKHDVMVSLIKVPHLKGVLYLILKVQNALLIDSIT